MRRYFPALLGLFILAPVVAATAATPDLSGFWALNVEDSDDPHEIARDRLDNRRRVYDGGLPGGQARRPGGREIPPSLGDGLRRPEEGVERLEIVHQEPLLVIRFADGLERRVFTDDRAPVDDFGIGLLSASAKWKKQDLVFSAESAYGGKLKEIYRLSPDGGRLTVTVKREAGRGPSIVFTRVYDRAEPWERFSSDDADADPSAPGSR